MFSPWERYYSDQRNNVNVKGKESRKVTRNYKTGRHKTFNEQEVRFFFFFLGGTKFPLE